MLGYGEMREVMLWVQVTEKAKIHFEYWETSNSKIKFKSKVVDASARKNILQRKLHYNKSFTWHKLSVRTFLSTTKK